MCLLRLYPTESLPGGATLQVAHTLQGHTSSVRALSASRSARRLLFSGGARASLKVWSIGEPCELGWCHGVHYFVFPQPGDDTEVCLDTGLFLCDDVQEKKRKKRSKFKPLGADVLPECRVMALSSFPLHEMYSGSSQADLVHTLHYVAAGCSDALIRYRGEDRGHVVVRGSDDDISTGSISTMKRSEYSPPSNRCSRVGIVCSA